MRRDVPPAAFRVLQDRVAWCAGMYRLRPFPEGQAGGGPVGEVSALVSEVSALVLRHTRLPMTPCGQMPHTRLPMTPCDQMPHTRLPMTPRDQMPHTRLPMTPCDQMPHTRLPMTPRDQMPHTRLPMIPRDLMPPSCHLLRSLITQGVTVVLGFRVPLNLHTHHSVGHRGPRGLHHSSLITQGVTVVLGFKES